MDVNHRFVSLAREAFQTFVSLDARIFRTLHTLLFRPGALTEAFNAGQRVRYTPPIRLYLITSLLFFVALGISASRTADAEQEAPAEATESEVVTRNRAIAEEALRQDSTSTAAQTTGVLLAVVDSIQSLDRRIERDPVARDRFFAQTRQNLSRAMFLLLPVFAFIVYFLYLGSGRYYVQHLIFSLHFHTFTFLAFGSVFLIDWLLPEAAEAWLQVPVLCMIPVYLLLAMRRVYHEHWGLTLIKFVGLSVVYFLVFFVTFIAVFIVTIFLF